MTNTLGHRHRRGGEYETMSCDIHLGRQSETMQTINSPVVLQITRAICELHTWANNTTDVCAKPRDYKCVTAFVQSVEREQRLRSSLGQAIRTLIFYISRNLLESQLWLQNVEYEVDIEYLTRRIWFALVFSMLLEPTQGRQTFTLVPGIVLVSVPCQRAEPVNIKCLLLVPIRVSAFERTISSLADATSGRIILKAYGEKKPA